MDARACNRCLTSASVLPVAVHIQGELLLHPNTNLNLATYLSRITVKQKESGVRTPLSLLCGFRFTASVPQQEPSHRGDVPSDELPRSRAGEVVPPILRRAKHSGGHPSSGSQAATPIQGGARGHNAQQPEQAVRRVHKPVRSKPRVAMCKLQAELRVQFSSSRKLLPQ
jgi:hypothetical protein